jgi:hypothetical protein
MDFPKKAAREKTEEQGKLRRMRQGAQRGKVMGSAKGLHWKLALAIAALLVGHSIITGGCLLIMTSPLLIIYKNTQMT